MAKSLRRAGAYSYNHRQDTGDTGKGAAFASATCCFRGAHVAYDAPTVFLLLKKIIFWTYGRTAWQYDMLCALILAFIFLTPKSWFDTSERMRCAEHQKIPAASTSLPTAPAQMPAALPDTQASARRAQVASRTFARAHDARPVGSAAGTAVAYRVDIK